MRSNAFASSTKEVIGVGALQISELAKKYVNQALDNNRLSYGPFSKAFESAVAEEHQVKYACFMNSGTDALRLALQAMKEHYGWKNGDEVIVPTVTFVATINIVLQNNMVPIFVDVDPATYNMDSKKIEARITKKTRAIIPVHLMGLPCEMDTIMKIAKKHRLRILEDSCEAMFASYKDKKVGSFGDVGAFSTYVAHYLVTGVGGLTTTNNAELATDIRSLMNHGRDSAYLMIDDDDQLDEQALARVIKKRFRFVKVGYSSRCTEMEAALGLAQIQEKNEIVSARREIAMRFNEQLKDLEGRLQLPIEPEGCFHTYMLYPIVLRREAKTDLVNYLEKHNIETRDLMPILTQPIYKKMYGNLESRYPVARWIDRSGFYIGCHQHISLEEQNYVIEVLHDYFRSH